VKREPAARPRSTLPIAAALCALGAGSLAMAAVRTAVHRQLAELRELRELLKRTSSEIEELELTVARLVSIEQLEPAARRLGMHYPEPGQLIGPRRRGEASTAGGTR
jgi:hypothetical protein